MSSITVSCPRISPLGPEYRILTWRDALLTLPRGILPHAAAAARLKHWHSSAQVFLAHASLVHCRASDNVVVPCLLPAGSGLYAAGRLSQPRAV